jgi:hypothetical protein
MPFSRIIKRLSKLSKRKWTAELINIAKNGTNSATSTYRIHVEGYNYTLMALHDGLYHEDITLLCLSDNKEVRMAKINASKCNRKALLQVLSSF